jgi:hypothetical protein
MTATVQKLLTEIDALSDSEKHEIAVAILHRSTTGDFGEVSDEDLTSLALERFIELDKEEAGG